MLRAKFGGDLGFQRRYPAVRSPGNDPEYVLFEKLTDEDLAYSIERLHAEANAKRRHADALELWRSERIHQRLQHD